ncbi:MAG: hypothetical protein IJ565_01255 [Bacilli bacterium]|nr:hypothetical protein [Bacilli bacterium]
MNNEFGIDLNKVSRDMHKNYNGIYLTDAEVSILKSNGFDINKYSSIKDLMFDLEDSLELEENEELEMILVNISEFNYYHNTNK